MSNGTSNVPGAGLPVATYGAYTGTTVGTTLPTDYLATPYFDVVNAIWPGLRDQQAFVAPARNGMNRRTGKLLQGWNHVEQSLELIFATPFHERVLRRWVGSFVPHILGESMVPRVITRFFWAIASAIDIWEPNYRIKQVFFMGDALDSWRTIGGTTADTLAAADLIRLGQAIFRQEGVYRPRAHLGDFTPYVTKYNTTVSRGADLWDVYPRGSL
jgi:uncharacterized protein